MAEQKTDVEKVIKSPSKKLREVLYRLWEKTEAESAFQKFYDVVMDKITDEFIKKLEKGGEK